MPWASFSMLDGPGGTPPASAKTQVSLTRFLQSELKIIHIIVQNNIYYSARSRWTKQQQKVKYDRPTVTVFPLRCWAGQ